MHTIEQLIGIAREYYTDDWHLDAPERAELPEGQRRRAAHLRACARARDWRAMLRRLQAKLPGLLVLNRSIYRESPESAAYDLSYSGKIDVPTKSPEEQERYIGFMASIVVPYFMFYHAASFTLGSEYVRGFDFGEQERGLVTEIRDELVATFPGYSLMPEEVGNVLVPGVRAGFRRPGEATLYDCLFSDVW